MAELKNNMEAAMDNFQKNGGLTGRVYVLTTQHIVDGIQVEKTWNALHAAGYITDADHRNSMDMVNEQHEVISPITPSMRIVEFRVADHTGKLHTYSSWAAAKEAVVEKK